MSNDSSQTIVNNTSISGNNSGKNQKKTVFKEKIEKSNNKNNNVFNQLKKIENFNKYINIHRNKKEKQNIQDKAEPYYENKFNSVDSFTYTHSSFMSKNKKIFDDKDLIISNKNNANSSFTAEDAKLL